MLRIFKKKQNKLTELDVKISSNNYDIKKLESDFNISSEKVSEELSSLEKQITATNLMLSALSSRVNALEKRLRDTLKEE